MALNRNLIYAGPVDKIEITTPTTSHTVNYTVGDVEVSCRTNYRAIRHHRGYGICGLRKMSHEFSVRFQVPELTLEMIKLAFAQVDANLSSTKVDLDVTQLGGLYGVQVWIPSSTGRVKYIDLTAMVLSGQPRISVARGGQLLYEIGFRSVCPESAAGVYGAVYKS